MELHAASRDGGRLSGVIRNRPRALAFAAGAFPALGSHQGLPNRQWLPMNLLDPQGPVAAANSTILVDSVFIMLAIVVPTIIAILAFAFWFRASNPRAQFQPDFVY